MSRGPARVYQSSRPRLYMAISWGCLGTTWILALLEKEAMKVVMARTSSRLISSGLKPWTRCMQV